MLSPGFLVIAAELGIPVGTLGQSTAWLILTIGLSLFIMNPLAKVWGRRPVFLIAIFVMFACSVWGAYAKDYSSFLASRVVAGFGMAPYEVLVQCTIGDLYFVHQRATRISAWNLFLLSGISGGSLISGYIIQVNLAVLHRYSNTRCVSFLTNFVGHRLEMDIRDLCHLLWRLHSHGLLLRSGNSLHARSNRKETS